MLKQRLRFYVAGFAAIFLLPALAVQAQYPSAADRTYIRDVMETNKAEIQLGQLALDKSSNPLVRQFGQKMIDDHGRLNDEIKPLAVQLHINSPQSLSPLHQALRKQLQGESGTSFDRDYIKAMVSGHRGAVAAFKKEASTGQDPAIKKFAAQAEPTIAGHLQMAENLMGKV